ncbi:MAG: hypothetical protein ACFCVA_07800 [Gammaproteobacteria bacterium]
MLISEPLPFVKAFVAELDAALRGHRASARGLSARSRRGLSFCLMAIMITNSLGWTRFERAGLGRYSQAALSWMFCRAKWPWEGLLQHSVRMILRRHGIGSGSRVLDDTDKRGSQGDAAHRPCAQAQGQSERGLSDGPVSGVAFYEPDPVRRAWLKQDKKLKRQGLAKGQRPPEPPRNPVYPTQPEWGLRLLEPLRQWHPTYAVQCVLTDALYGMAAFMGPAGAVFNGVQVISPLRGHQKVHFRNRSLSLEQYFDRYPGVVQRDRRRGGQSMTVWVSSARLRWSRC